MSTPIDPVTATVVYNGRTITYHQYLVEMKLVNDVAASDQDAFYHRSVFGLAMNAVTPDPTVNMMKYYWYRFKKRLRLGQWNPVTPLQTP